MKNRIIKIIKVFSFAFTAGVIIVMFTPLANLLARPLIVRHPEPRKADVIVVLGGGALKNGSLTGASNERLIKGLLLYRDRLAPRIVFAGGTIVEPSQKLAHTVFGSKTPEALMAESAIMRDIAGKLGMSDKDIATDPESVNTYENLKAAKVYMEANGLKKCLIVTSTTHMRRAALVAQKLGIDYAAAPIEDYTAFRKGGVERLGLLHEVLWEYAALALYKVYGYI